VFCFKEILSTAVCTFFAKLPRIGDSEGTASAFEQADTCLLCDCDLSCLHLAVLVAMIASYLQSGSREWHPSGRPRRTYNLLFGIPQVDHEGHTTCCYLFVICL